MLTDILKSLVKIPGLQLLLMFMALLLWFRFRQLAFQLMLLSFVSLYLFSTRPVANLLMANLERYPVFSSVEDTGHPEAIVILGTGVLGNTPEYDMAPQPGALLAQRLRYGAQLAKQTDIPVLVSGGSVYGINEADVMARYLAAVDVSVRWRESTSLNTWENAAHSASILSREGIQRVILITHGWHMARSVVLFEKVGLSVVPAPTASAVVLSSHEPYSAWLPDIRWLRSSQLALTEYASMVRDRLFY